MGAMRAKNGRARLDTGLGTRPDGRGEEGKIHQVLVNLIDNAPDAVKDIADARVAVTMRAQAHDVPSRSPTTALDLGRGGRWRPELLLHHQGGGRGTGARL